MATSLPPKGEPEKRIGAHFAPLSVTQQEIPNMTVKIRGGSFFNTQDVFTEFGGGSTAVVTAPATNAKWVLVCVTDSATLQLVDGIAEATPSLPDVPANTLPLAALYVTSTTTALTSTAIVDVRPFLRAANVVPDISEYVTIVDFNNGLATKADTSDVADSFNHTHVLANVTDITALPADINQLAGVNISTTYATNTNLDLKANRAGDTFTGTVTVHTGVNQPISLVSSDTGSSGLSVDRGVDPEARLEWDNTAEAWLVGTTGSMNTILTAAVVDTKVDRSGDTMTGNLAMSNNKVTGLAAATVNGDAVRYDEFSVHNHDAAYVNVSGDTVTGNLVFTGGAHVVSQTQFVTLGDAQSRERAVYAETTDATVTELFVDGTAGTSRLVMADNTTWMFEVTIVARRTDVAGENAAYRFDGAIARDVGAASTTVVNVAETVIAEDTPAWSVTVDADVTNGSLRVQVTGELAKTIRWVAFVKTVEVSV